MIKDFVVRAMQIAYMERDQIKRLHEVERLNRHLLPNWNIQEIFGLAMIKDRFGIPTVDDAQRNHNTRIETEIKNHGFTKAEVSREEENAHPDTPSSILWTHSFDWNVHRGAGKIVWEYSGGSGRNSRASDGIKRQETYP